MHMNHGGNLIVYIAENTTSKQGTPHIDFAGFVGRQNGEFVLDFTRNPARRIGHRKDNKQPTGKLVFCCVEDVKEFVKNVISDVPHDISLTVEVHVVPDYSLNTTFFDLWENTDKYTEVTAFDDATLAQMGNILTQLENVRRVGIMWDE